MANWQRHLRLQPEYGRAQDDELSICELAGVVAKRLRALRPLGDESLDNERDEIAEEFESLAGDPNASTNDFDEAMHRLFDWGDTSLDESWNGKKACWVDTISDPARSAAKAGAS